MFSVRSCGKTLVTKTQGTKIASSSLAIFVPCVFVRSCGKTLVTKTQGTKIASEELKNRVLELNLADLNNVEDDSHKKVKLCIEEVQGRNCLTNFHGMCLTR